MYRHDQPQRRRASKWNWLWLLVPLIIGTITFYVADYCNMVDVPLFDETYDRAKRGN